MDWHKLQRTLYNLDPVDLKEDLAKLRESVSKSAPAVNESVDYVNQSYQVPEGSMPTDRDYSVSDFAALAGIKLTEGKQKEGRPGQAKHSDPKPKKLPAGSTKNVSKDKLVGDSTDNNLEEGPKLNAFAKGFQNAGKSAEIGLDMAKKTAFGDSPNQPKDQGKPKKQVNVQRLKTMFGVDDPAFVSAIKKINAPGEQTISTRESQALAKAFTNMMNMNPRDIQKNMNILKTQVSGTESTMPREQESIKERLYRELRQKGL